MIYKYMYLTLYPPVGQYTLHVYYTVISIYFFHALCCRYCKAPEDDGK